MDILNEKIKWVRRDVSTVGFFDEEKRAFHASMLLDIFSTLKPNTLYRVENNQFIEHIEVPPKDARVLVSDWEGETGDWLHRYSTGETDKAGQVLCYTEGRTSWTNKGDAVPWKYWKLPEEEK